MEGANFNAKKPRILVIDDDVDLAHSLKELLELEGALVDVAYNGNEGVFQHIQSPYDLIITDIVMPVMDGLEVVMWVKENSPKTKLLVVSGGGYYDSKDYLIMAKELGADCVMQKPIDFERILKTVRESFTI
jgi:DNA-binding response OmpR family regulator